MAQTKQRSFSDHQGHIPVSVKLWPEQRREVDGAAKALGISRSRLMRHGALVVARELAAGAERPCRLHR